MLYSTILQHQPTAPAYSGVLDGGAVTCQANQEASNLRRGGTPQEITPPARSPAGTPGTDTAPETSREEDPRRALGLSP